MIFWQDEEEEEFLITKRYGVGGGGVFDNQNIYGGGQARAQGNRLGYQGADQQGEGHGFGVECRIRVGGCVTSLRW